MCALRKYKTSMRWLSSLPITRTFPIPIAIAPLPKPHNLQFPTNRRHLLHSVANGTMQPSNWDWSTLSYLTQRQASEIDEFLMGPLGFSVDQLMELAGLSVACSIHEVYPPHQHQRVLILCGPGNNGGDGLVAARHLHHFQYSISVCYPKRTSNPLYAGLVTQLESLSIPFLTIDEIPENLTKDFDLIVDAIFGFSFHGPPRPPFDCLIHKMKRFAPVVSIDVPSGWEVEEENEDEEGLKPQMLVSLTAPKLCAKKFTGSHHFLGGRFVPPSITHKFDLRLPPYPGASMCVRIGKSPKPIDIASLRENYVSPELHESLVDTDPFVQFRKWFDEAVASGSKEPNAMALSTVGRDMKPSSRMVLLKGIDEGFVWYTNYESKKGKQIAENPRASLLFHWASMNRQVRIEGPVEKVSETTSESYFHSRPRGSQLGAVASHQSAVVSGREVLSEKYRQLEERFRDGVVIPKPDEWGGFRVLPEIFEFWQGQPSRLHDRLQYSSKKVNGVAKWEITRLAP